MSLPLVIKPEAEVDLAETCAWYEGRQAGLGDDFLLCVDQAFEIIQKRPELQAKVFEELRLASVRRFPYLIVYRIDGDQITVVAVYHNRRNPREWQARS